jgi:hypothetical protein
MCIIDKRSGVSSWCERFESDKNSVYQKRNSELMNLPACFVTCQACPLAFFWYYVSTNFTNNMGNEFFSQFLLCFSKRKISKKNILARVEWWTLGNQLAHQGHLISIGWAIHHGLCACVDAIRIISNIQCRLSPSMTIRTLWYQLQAMASSTIVYMHDACTLPSPEKQGWPDRPGWPMCTVLRL